MCPHCVASLWCCILYVLYVRYLLCVLCVASSLCPHCVASSLCVLSVSSLFVFISVWRTFIEEKKITSHDTHRAFRSHEVESLFSPAFLATAASSAQESTVKAVTVRAVTVRDANHSSSVTFLLRTFLLCATSPSPDNVPAGPYFSN